MVNIQDPIGGELDREYAAIQRAVSRDEDEPAQIIADQLDSAYFDMTTIGRRLKSIRDYANTKGYNIREPN